MFFSIDKEILINNLNVISKGLPSKTPLPILMGIKIEVSAKSLTLTTSNTDISIKTEIADKSLAVEIGGSVLVPGRFFIDIIRSISGRTIEMSLVEDKIFVIKSERSEFKLNVLDIDDYPNIEFIDQENPLVLESKTLKTIIRETSFATSVSEKRPVLTGVNFNITEEQITCIATDSFRLSQKSVYPANKSSQSNIIIPNKSLDELLKILDSYNDDVNIYIERQKVLFEFENVLYQTRLLEGNYPDTSRLIPTAYPVIIKFNKEDLLSALERVSLLSPKDREKNYSIIKLNLKANHVVEITSNNSEIGDALEEIIPIDVEGPQIRIAFSSKYLIDALRVFTSNEITLNFTGEVKPFIIKGENDKNLIHLILPVKID